MKNQVIKVLNTEHGKKVIQYWKDKGINVNGYNGVYTNYYYGMIDNKFSFYSLEAIQKHGCEIITLPENNIYPKVMLVSNDIISTPVRRVVFMEKNDRYLAWNEATTIGEAGNIVNVSNWKYAKDIPVEPEFIELSLKDISAKFKIPLNKLRIKD